MDLELYKVREAAKILKYTRPTVYRLINSGKLKAFRLSAHGIRIKKQDLFEFMRENEIRPKLELVKRKKKEV